MSEIRKLVHLVVAILCLGAAIAVLRNNGLPNQDVKSLRSGQRRSTAVLTVGSKAPEFTLQSHTLENFTLGQASGPTVLNFWATWCQPCRAEMTQLQALFESNPESARLIGINLGESFLSVGKWVEDLGLTFTVLLDPKLTVASNYAIRGVPTTILLDSRMTVQKIHYGPVSAKQLLQEVDDLTNKS